MGSMTIRSESAAIGHASLRRADAGAVLQGSPAVLRRMGAAMLLVLTGVALANITLALQHKMFAGPSWQDSLASLLLALTGITLVWRGLALHDVPASILGFVGGALLWMGFFEWTWANGVVLLDIQPLEVDGQPVLPASLLLVQASAFIFLPLVLLMAANGSTRCRMMLWCRRHLHLPAPPRATVSKSGASRVAATETLFVIWFIYLLNIALYDPRLLGRGPEIYYASATLIGLWGAYLVSRMRHLRDSGMLIRYAIPTAYLLSIPVDAMTMAGWFPAFWVQPLRYPLAAVVVAGVFLAAVAVLLIDARPGRGRALTPPPAAVRGS